MFYNIILSFTYFFSDYGLKLKFVWISNGFIFIKFNSYKIQYQMLLFIGVNEKSLSKQIEGKINNLKYEYQTFIKRTY